MLSAATHEGLHDYWRDKDSMCFYNVVPETLEKHKRILWQMEYVNERLMYMETCAVSWNKWGLVFHRGAPSSIRGRCGQTG